MFDLWCPASGCRVLRWWSDIVSVTHPEPGGIDVLLRCECGALALLRTGRARDGADETIHGLDPDALAGSAARGVGLLR